LNNSCTINIPDSSIIKPSSGKSKPKDGVKFTSVDKGKKTATTNTTVEVVLYKIEISRELKQQ
jgi:hypothetical protein